MKYIDLIEQLSSEDKEKIKNYISLFGVNIKDFMGVEQWLQNWSHSKQILYKLLGNQFIYKVPFNYEKSKDEIYGEISTLIARDTFKSNYHEFYWDYIRRQDYIDPDSRSFFNHLFDVSTFVADKVEYSLKIKKPGAKKILQIQRGTKPMRAIQKVMGYFDEEWNWNHSAFDDFRVAVSRIFNDKHLTGNMCYSIHPLDFMTMSDNNSNWTSCMSWTDDGCYRIGTVEMMNSNNVICCYIERGTDWCFGGNLTAEDGSIDSYMWNDKKWRILAYVTKDIIMSGKSYPYKNDTNSNIVIATLKELAEKNLNWHYSFGPELYKDMKYVNSEFPLDRSRRHIRHHSTTKHNILWDTHGMYNDMLNDHERKYWCFRNKVNQNKVISVSGKCPCLCCGKQVVEYEGYETNYNERYTRTGEVLCYDCNENHRCDSCSRNSRFYNYTDVIVHPKPDYNTGVINNNVTLRLCELCIKNNIYVCPGCGEPILIDEYRHIESAFSSDINIELFKAETYPLLLDGRKNGSNVFMCYDCFEKNKDDFTIKTILPKRESCHYYETEYDIYGRNKWVLFNGDKKYYYPNIKRWEGAINTPIKEVPLRKDIIKYLT